jgi:hypothetical protein
MGMAIVVKTMVLLFTNTMNYKKGFKGIKHSEVKYGKITEDCLVKIYPMMVLQKHLKVLN